MITTAFDGSGEFTVTLPLTPGCRYVFGFYTVSGIGTFGCTEVEGNASIPFFATLGEAPALEWTLSATNSGRLEFVALTRTLQVTGEGASADALLVYGLELIL